MWDVITDAISTGSFTALWYWLAVAAFWVWTVRRVLGLPQDMLLAARRDGAAAGLLADMAQVMAQAELRRNPLGDLARVTLLALVFGLTSALGFFYGIELAQAAWFILTPYLGISVLRRRAARRVLAHTGDVKAVLRALYSLSIVSQVIVFVFIFMNFIFAFVHIATLGYLG